MATNDDLVITTVSEAEIATLDVGEDADDLPPPVATKHDKTRKAAEEQPEKTKTSIKGRLSSVVASSSISRSRHGRIDPRDRYDDRRDRDRDDYRRRDDGGRMRSETDLRGQSREFSSSAPDVVPTGGYYFEHDDREDSRGRGRDRRTGDNRRYGEGGGRNPRLSAADTAGMWTHDKFETMDEEEPEVNDAGSSFTRDDRPPRVVEDSDGARGRVFRSDTRGNRGGRDGGVQDRLGFRGDNGRPRDGAWERRNGTGRDRGDTGAVRGATYDRVPRGGMRMDTSGYRDRGGPRWGAQSSRSGGRETQPEWLQRERESRRQAAGSKPDGRSSHSTDSGRNGDNSRREGRDRGRDRSRDRQRDAGDGATGTAKETKLDEELSEVYRRRSQGWMQDEDE